MKNLTDHHSRTEQAAIPEYFNIGNACTKPNIDGFSMTQAAVIVDQSHQGTQTLNYAELHEQSNRFAHALAKLGLEKSDRAMLWLPNCIEFPVSFFGPLKIGAPALPLSLIHISAPTRPY